jgi:hypothetical protein
MDNGEVDINVLVTIYNQKLSTLMNQNILLEAKLKTLQTEYADEKDSLLLKISELSREQPQKSRKKVEDYQQSGVE